MRITYKPQVNSRRLNQLKAVDSVKHIVMHKAPEKLKTPEVVSGSKLQNFLNKIKNLVSLKSRSN